jgi:hypothetical protein
MSFPGPPRHPIEREKKRVVDETPPIASVRVCVEILTIPSFPIVIIVNLILEKIKTKKANKTTKKKNNNNASVANLFLMGLKSTKRTSPTHF